MKDMVFPILTLFLGAMLGLFSSLLSALVGHRRTIALKLLDVHVRPPKSDVCSFELPQPDTGPLYREMKFAALHVELAGPIPGPPERRPSRAPRPSDLQEPGGPPPQRLATLDGPVGNSGNRDPWKADPLGAIAIPTPKTWLLYLTKRV